MVTESRFEKEQREQREAQEHEQKQRQSNEQAAREREAKDDAKHPGPATGLPQDQPGDAQAKSDQPRRGRSSPEEEAPAEKISQDLPPPP